MGSLVRGARTAVLTAFAAAALLALAGPASARTVPLYTYTGDYYDGFGSTVGSVAAGTDVAVDQSTGNGLVTDAARGNGGSFSQFDPAGNPVAFSALEGATSVSTIVDGSYRIAVDDSGTATEGNIYVVTEKLIKGYHPDGTEIAEHFPIGGFRAPCGVAVDNEGDIWGVDYRRALLVQYTPSGDLIKSIPMPPVIDAPLNNGGCDLAIDSQDNFYLEAWGYKTGPQETITYAYGKKFDPEGNYLYDFSGGYVQSVAVDRSTDHVFVLQPSPFANGEYNYEVIEYDENGDEITSFGAPDPAHSFEGLTAPTGLAFNEQTDEIYVTNGRDYGGRQHVEFFKSSGQAVVPTVRTIPPGLTATSATLKGTVDLDGGGDTTACYFEWGTTYAYGNTLPCAPAGPISGAGPHEVTAALGGLTQGASYHYRLVSKNANEILAYSSDRAFRPQTPAEVSGILVSEVNTDGALISADINPNGGETTYRVEYGTEDCDLGGCSSLPLRPPALENVLGIQHVTVLLTGLKADTTYHYRVVATNDAAEVEATEDTLRTYGIDSYVDNCANALVRKGMGAVLLPDCRAYELVSAADAGGYDVRSDLVPGQFPFLAKPRAVDGLLYSLNYGKVPGVAGEPTNHELDPYVATRTPDGWTTSYAGIPVGGPPFQDSFGSKPLGESEDLSTFAFGGPDICSPCFGDGKTGIPLRRDGGPLIQGMVGSLDPGPSAVPDGFIAEPLSGDGTHLIFGSTSAFEGDAATGGDVSIYDHNLLTGATHVVSKTPGGANLPCLQGSGSCHSPANGDGIASLAISEDGSRIVVANRVATDSAGNDYWHPYMNIGDSTSTVDLAPGTTAGVLFDGMTDDGSAVLYTTADQLTSDDHDTSADIYRAGVAADGAVSLTRVSSGSGAGDTDSCDPVASPGRNNWNAPGAASPNRCSAVAFAGGSGVARGSGAIYFLSPEQLDGGSGVAGEPNLYMGAPGASPSFIATLEPSNPAIANAVDDSAAIGFGDIQVTPSGEFAAFASNRALTGFPNVGHTAIFRYAAATEQATTAQLDCASCPTTRASLTAETRLSPYGLNLADDGRVFYTSTEPLALQDTGGTADVYEWSAGRISMLSTGRSQTDAGLLSVSADGVNAFFYTRETLAGNDRNGHTLKIYTAREGGGLAFPPSLGACQASDECHGPSSSAPATESLPTFNGTGGNYNKTQKKHRKRKKHRHHRHKKHHRSHRAGRNG
jgi:hypothetical protein